MPRNRIYCVFMSVLVSVCIAALSFTCSTVSAQDTMFKAFRWESQPPAGCPFEKSEDITGIVFTGRHSDYHFADTWYPSWASDDRMYSPYTDGPCPRLDGGQDISASYSGDGVTAETGQAVMEGDDPLSLHVYSLGKTVASAKPYGGRYPCGSLVHDGIWYYGTYCLAPYGQTTYAGFTYNWPWLGPLVGFRISEDYGRTWKETPHTPSKPLFGESGMWGEPVKIGSPHFVDFGKNMEHSPDGKAYLVGHGAIESDAMPRFGNLSWISGDQIYLLRVVPSVETINDASAYEFFGGHDKNGAPVWTSDFTAIKPLIDWNNNCGCVTVTYNAPLKKYLMCVTDGWPTCAKMNSYILESNAITGPWKMITYMKNFGEQGYFLNFPSKFISDDGRTAWLCYSGNFARDWNGVAILENPPGSHYGLVLQEVKLTGR
ncbi:hypothetical protein LLG96_11190 [bacterium]|nr:hypothetical protein [bacterium]